MKILVFGAGPLGTLMAVRLYEAGHEVTILARNERLRQLREHGCVIREEGATALETARVPVTDRFAPDDAYDLVMIVMRRNHAVEIIDTLAANAKVASFLFMVNSAAGPEEYVRALGRERVLLGFPYPGGERAGHIMHVVPVNEAHPWTIPVGEVDGRVTDRTRAIAGALGSMRGYKVQIRKDMDAWLKNHVALLMSAFAPAIYAANIDMRRLANTRDLLVLAVRGMKEALRGVRKAGIPFSPASVRMVLWMPEPLLVTLFARRMRDESLRSSIEGHPRAARDELVFLARELLDLLRAHGVRTPVCDRMFKYYDPETPPVAEGSGKIPLKWGGVVASVAVLAAIGAAVVLLFVL